MHPRDMGQAEIEAFLTYLANYIIKDEVSAESEQLSTANCCLIIHGHNAQTHEIELHAESNPSTCL